MADVNHFVIHHTNSMSTNNNHLKLARFHFFFAASYFCLIMALLTDSFYWLVLTPIPILHFILGIGARHKNELSRRISEFVGALMIFAFPIGTFLAFYFLPYTEWEDIKE